MAALASGILVYSWSDGPTFKGERNQAGLQSPQKTISVIPLIGKSPKHIVPIKWWNRQDSGKTLVWKSWQGQAQKNCGTGNVRELVHQGNQDILAVNRSIYQMPLVTQSVLYHIVYLTVLLQITHSTQGFELLGAKLATVSHWKTNYCNDTLQF